MDPSNGERVAGMACETMWGSAIGERDIPFERIGNHLRKQSRRESDGESEREQQMNTATKEDRSPREI